MKVNQFGLKRRIPDYIKREVRRRSKNGCIICRSLLYTYQHFDPEYVHAREHNADGICLLCPNCHDITDKKRILTKEQIRKAYIRVDQNPNVKPPFQQLHFSGSPVIEIGTAKFKFPKSRAVLVEYDGKDILSFSYVTDEIFGGFRPSLNGTLSDEFGHKVIEFSDNELRVVSKGTDVVFSGRKISIRRNPRNFVLEFEIMENASFKITRLLMRYRDLICEFEKEFGATALTRSGETRTVLFDRIQCQDTEVLVSYKSDKSLWDRGGDWELFRAGGTAVPLTGCTLMKGGTSFHIAKMICTHNRRRILPINPIGHRFPTALNENS